MAVDPEELRAQAQEWGRAFLFQPPWEPLSERLSLILVSPPSEAKFDHAPPAARLWLLVDRASLGGLPETVRQQLKTGAMVEHHRAVRSVPAIELSVRIVEAVEDQVERTGPRDFELRWALLHSVPVSDRLRRLEPLAARARLLPPDGLERAVRALWLDAYAATRALWTLTVAPAHSLTAAGELSGALLRLACLMDEGAYPPADLLRSEATGTRIGQRLSGWLDDMAAGLAGDEAAGRRTVTARDQVLDEVRLVLRERYPNSDWLRDPAVYELRARR